MACFQKYPLQTAAAITLVSALLGVGAHVALGHVDAPAGLVRLLYVIVWVCYATAGLLAVLLVASVLHRAHASATKQTAMRHHVTRAHGPSRRPEQRRLIRRQRPLGRDPGGQP